MVFYGHILIFEGKLKLRNSLFKEIYQKFSMNVIMNLNIAHIMCENYNSSAYK